MVTTSPLNDSSALSGWLEQISDFAAGLPQPGLFAALGLASIAILSALILCWLVWLTLRVSHRVHVEAAMRAMQKDDTPGSKIMVARVSGAQGMSARAAILDALEHHLPEFNFGSAFYLGACPITIEATDFALSKADHTNLQAAFEKSGANVIIWGETCGSADGTMLCLATPAMLDGQNPNGFFAVKLIGAPSEWGETAKRAIAYVTGRRLRPALGRPADFRADRLLPIAGSMASLLESGPVLTGQAQTELEDDYAAAALHIGDQMKSPEWLDTAVTYRTRALAGMKRSEDPVRWAQAKLDLGRAMTQQCEHKFEPTRLQEAMAHVREAIDSTKTDSRMQLAELGIAALKQAETMLANRRRFSIRWNV